MIAIFEMKPLWRLLGLLMACGPAATAQYWQGVATGNYAGTQGMYLNPAAVADSRLKAYVHLAGYENYLYNNYLAWAAPYAVVGLLTNTVSNSHRNADGKIMFRNDYLGETLNGRRKHLRAGAELRGPALLYTLGDRHAVAVGSRVRAGLALSHTSESVARLLRYGTAQEEFISPQAFGQGFEANATGLLEVSATYGRVWLDNDEHFFKWGFTLKRLIGVAQNHLHAQGIDYELQRTGDILLTSVSAKYGFTSSAALSGFRPTPAWLLGSAPAGSGWAADAGLVYEYRPEVRKYTYREKGQVRRDASRNKYLYRVSVSLLDVGGLQFRNPALVSHYFVQRSNQTLTKNAFGGVSNPQQLEAAINQTLNVSESENQRRFWMHMPLTLQTSFDYQVREKWYVNVLWLHNFIPNSKITQSMPSQVAVVPRYERRWLEVSVPISLLDNYSRLGLGLAARLGPVYVGTEHLTGLLSLGRPKGIEFYAGAYIPVFRRAPQSPLQCLPQHQDRRGLFGFLKKRH